jgi:hypothetical protein
VYGRLTPHDVYQPPTGSKMFCKQRKISTPLPTTECRYLQSLLRKIQDPPYLLLSAGHSRAGIAGSTPRKQLQSQ